MLVMVHSHRRQLMLVNFNSMLWTCLDIEWEGWMLTAFSNKKGDARGLHDQYYHFNAKNLINSLLSRGKTLQIGGNLYLCKHIELMF